MDPIVVFGFDMETDVGSWSPYYEGIKNATPKMLRTLDEYDVPATFFFTGDAAREFPDIVRTVSDAGHEVGCHSLYHETVGDPLFPIPGVQPLLPEEVPLRLRRATEIVAESLGDRPVSFRCPRLWGSTAVINALEDLGYVADASYPLYFYEEQLAPYHPSADNWTKAGDLDLLEIPNFADMGMQSEDEYGRDRDQWPLFRTESARALTKHVNSFIEYVEERNIRPVLCFYMHPWEFERMPERIHYGEGTVIPDEFIVKNCGEYALQQLAELISLLQDAGSVFLTARDLAAEWDDIKQE
ncbi:MAG: polysaccharide deacetylase family protein [Armatimonadota bacterium]